MTPASPGAESSGQHDAALRQLGVSAEALAKAPAKRPETSDFKPWPWHMDAMRLFGGMRTQWIAEAGLTGLVYLGLNYPSLDTVQRHLGIPDSPDLFDQLQAIERGALAYLNARHTA